MKIPDGYELICRNNALIVVRTEYRSCLLEQGIDRPDLLFKQAAFDERTGRGKIGVLPIKGRPQERMIVRQCLRGGIVRIFNREGYLRNKRPFEELWISEFAASVGIPTAQVLAAVSVRTPGRLWKNYLFIKELPECLDVPTYLMMLWKQNPCRFFNEKHRILCTISELIKQMHNRGIEHGDLNMKNVLINTHDPGKIYIIDWDKSRIKSRLGWAARRANVLRLCRSLVKLGRLGFPFNQHDAARLLQAYSGRKQRFRRDFIRLRFSTRIRSLFWKRVALPRNHIPCVLIFFLL